MKRFFTVLFFLLWVPVQAEDLYTSSVGFNVSADQLGGRVSQLFLDYERPWGHLGVQLDAYRISPDDDEPMRNVALSASSDPLADFVVQAQFEHLGQKNIVSADSMHSMLTLNHEQFSIRVEPELSAIQLTTNLPSLPLYAQSLGFNGAMDYFLGERWMLGFSAGVKAYRYSTTVSRLVIRLNGLSTANWQFLSALHRKRYGTQIAWLGDRIRLSYAWSKSLSLLDDNWSQSHSIDAGYLYSSRVQFALLLNSNHTPVPVANNSSELKIEKLRALGLGATYFW